MDGWNCAIVRQNLFLTAELLRVYAVFKECGIEAIPLKGAALAADLYNDIALRPFSDIDLLVKREQVDAAETVIREVAYEAEFAIPPEHRKRWMKQQCELTFRRSGSGVRLELHWDIAHPHFALDTGVDEFWIRLTTMRIGDATLPSLSPTDLLFTLIVHGTRHAWSRVMWLVDIAELLGQDTSIDWVQFWRNAKLRGATRMMATGLVLAERAFGISLPKGAGELAHRDQIAVTLADRVIDHWNKSIELSASIDPEPTTMWRHRWIMRSRENRTQRWRYARNVLTMTGDEEFNVVRLPGALAPLYGIVRFWNIFRRARPRARAASAQSKG